LPADLQSKISLHGAAPEALVGADALVLATEWPDYLSIGPATVVSTMKNPTVLDPSRFLASTLGTDPRIRYVTVGRPVRPHV
jgi:UDPglucose 6-dehydrogenase